FFPTWARYSDYTEQDIDFSTVTHVAHFSATPRADGSLYMSPWEPPSDPALITGTHAAGAKIVLVVSDYGESRSGFQGLAASAATRWAFARNLLEVLNADGYDGVDLDWEFPRSAAERSNYVALVAQLRATLGPNRLISVDVPGSDYNGQWLDIAAMLPYLDWVGGMTYDFHGAGWSGRAGHNSPLYSTAADVALDGGQALSVDGARAYWQGRGVPASMLLIGLAFYGQRFDGAMDMREDNANLSGGTPDYREIA